jgi:hypothetical protein
MRMNKDADVPELMQDKSLLKKDNLEVSPEFD